MLVRHYAIALVFGLFLLGAAPRLHAQVLVWDDTEDLSVQTYNNEYYDLETADISEYSSSSPMTVLYKMWYEGGQPVNYVRIKMTNAVSGNVTYGPVHELTTTANTWYTDQIDVEDGQSFEVTIECYTAGQTEYTPDPSTIYKDALQIYYE